MTQPWAKENRAPIHQIHLDVSKNCDQKCPLCYNPPSTSQRDLSLEEIREIAKKYKGYAFILGGREPTTRKDLKEIIKIINPYGSTMLLTHGLSLANKNYLKSLLSSGLDGVIFSFNGLSDKTYKHINGKELFSEKWKVFCLLKKFRVPTVISMTILDGVNNNEIGAVLKLCRENNDFIKELRLRTAKPIGNYPQQTQKQLFMSDLIKNILNQTGFTRRDLFRGISFWHSIGKVFNIHAYKPRLCTFQFMIKKENGIWLPEGKFITHSGEQALKQWNHKKWKRPLYLFILLSQIIRLYGWKPVLRRIWFLKGKLFKIRPASHRLQYKGYMDCTNLLRITLKSWPTDLFLKEEKRKCHTLFISQKGCKPFCSQYKKDSKIQHYKDN